VALEGWQRLLEGALTIRALWAPVVGLAMLGLLMTVLLRAPLAALPGYSAVGLTFLIVIVLPGFVVQRAVLTAKADIAVRLAVSPALGVAIMTLPGFVALEVHTDLQAFEVMYACFAALACGAAVLFYRDATDDGEPVDPEGGRGSLVLLAMIAIVCGGVLTTPLWASERLAADFDDWTYMAYVREFLDTDHLNQDEPFLGTGADVNPRMRDNVWVLSQATISDAAGVPPRMLLLQFERPILTVCALAAMYALTRILFGKRSIALLAVAFMAGYGLLDLSAHEGFGRNLYLRISEDKMASAWVIFPVGLLFLTRFVQAPSRATYAGFALVVLAVAFVHPVPLVFLGAAIAALAAIRGAMERDVRTLIPPALLALPVGLAAIWPFVQRQLLVNVAPDLFETDASSITFRDQFHIVDLGHGVLMGNYHMILHPLVILAIVLTPFVWLAARKSASHQLVLAMTAGALFVFFVPVIATVVARGMTPPTLWKVPWMIPTAPVLAFATFQFTAMVRTWRPLRFVFGGRRLGTFVSALLPGFAVAVVLASAVVVMEQYRRADGKAFYDWTSTDTVVPGTNESIFRGGIDRSLSGSWRLDPFQRELLEYLERRIPPGSVVLAEPLILNRYIPGMMTDVSPVDFGGTAGEGQRRVDAVAFANGQLSVAELQAVVNNYSVDFIVVSELGPAGELVRSLPEAQLVSELTAHNLYQIAQ